MRRTIAALPVGALAIALAACTLPERAPERDWLPGFDASAIASPEAARVALEAAAARRGVLEADWERRERACYTRFFVNPCLADLRRERLSADDGIGRIEVAARERLREHDAIRRNRAEAERVAEEISRSDREAVDRQRAQAERAQREADAQVRERERAAEEARRPEVAAQVQARRKQRESEAAGARARAAERAARAPANRAGNEARLERNRQAQVERAEREARRRGNRGEPAAPAAPRIEPGPGGVLPSR